MSPEVGNRDTLPTFEIDAVVTPETIIATLERVPQTQLIDELWSMTHGPSPAQASNFIYRLIDLVRSEDWDDQDEDRIIVKQDPATMQEEEYMLLTNLRGSLDWLGWQILNASSIPAEQKAKFAVEERNQHLENESLDVAVSSLREWARANPEEASRPTDITPGIRQQSGRLCKRIRALADFYNEKQPLVAAYKIVYPDGYRKPEPFTDEHWEKRIALSKYDEDMMRYSVFGSVFGLLGAEDQAKNLADGIGAREAEAG